MGRSRRLQRPHPYIRPDVYHAGDPIGSREQLDPRRFVRVHRSTIVNIDRVREIQPYFHGAYILLLQDGTQIRLSRSRRHAFEEALGQTSLIGRVRPCIRR